MAILEGASDDHAETETRRHGSNAQDLDRGAGVLGGGDSVPLPDRRAELENPLGGIGSNLGGNDEDDWAISITGTGWIEKKKTGGAALYWYQRWRDKSLGGKPIKRSKYLAPYKGNEDKQWETKLTNQKS